MKDRLLKFLNKEQLSSARFADIIGVQPSSISHILSGRNKPGFDFIQKILTSYPSLNAEWLIMGKGNMLKSENIQGDLFTDEYYGTGNPLRTDKEAAGDKPEGTQDRTGTNAYDEDTYVNKLRPDDGYNSEPRTSDKVTDVNKVKVIQKIVIFYSDKSFSEYSPE